MNEQQEREDYLAIDPAYHEITKRKEAALAANVPAGWTDDQMIRFAWLVLNGWKLDPAPSIRERLGGFRSDEGVRGIAAPAPEAKPEAQQSADLPSVEHIKELAQEAFDQVMEQAQVFASAWSLVGGRFDTGNAMDDAEEAKTELRTMVRSLADLAAQTVRPLEAKPEPVAIAWMHKSGHLQASIPGLSPEAIESYKRHNWQPLYTAPVAVAWQWLPIETAPKDGHMFLCWVSAVLYGETDEGQQYQEDVSQVDFCQWRAHDEAPDGGWFDPCCGQISDHQRVTHWQPLPPAPEMEP